MKPRNEYLLMGIVMQKCTLGKDIEKGAAYKGEYGGLAHMRPELLRGYGDN